jgi:hypothetical protein
MAGVEDTNVIDVVAQDADGEYMIVMVESRPWGAERNQIEQLKAKINAYAGFVASGSFTKAFPEAAGMPLRIQLDCIEPLPPVVNAIVVRATAEFAKHGIGFLVNARR